MRLKEYLDEIAKVKRSKLDVEAKADKISGLTTKMTYEKCDRCGFTRKDHADDYPRMACVEFREVER